MYKASGCIRGIGILSVRLERPTGRAAQRPTALEAHTQARDGCERVSTRMCACVSVAVGRLPAQKGEWAAASAQAAGGPLPETPSRPWIPARVSSPGR